MENKNKYGDGLISAAQKRNTLIGFEQGNESMDSFNPELAGDPEAITEVGLLDSASVGLSLGGFNQTLKAGAQAISRDIVNNIGPAAGQLVDENYDIFKDTDYIEKDADYIKRYGTFLSTARSKIEADVMFEQYDKIEDQLKMLNDPNTDLNNLGVVTGYALAGLGDITSLIPGAALLKAPGLAGKIAATSGSALVASVLRDTIGNSVRGLPTEEAAINAGLAAMLGGVLVAGAKGASSLSQGFRVGFRKTEALIKEHGSIGAAMTRDPEASLLADAPNRFYQSLMGIVDNTIGQITPLGRMITSRYAAAREFVLDTVGTPREVKGATDIPLAYLAEAQHLDGMEKLSAIADYAAEYAARASKKGLPAIAREDFDKLVYKTLQKKAKEFEEGLPISKSDIPEVEKFINDVHKPFVEGRLISAKTAGLLEDVQNNPYYAPRRMKRIDVENNRIRFESIAAEEFRRLDNLEGIAKSDNDYEVMAVEWADRILEQRIRQKGVGGGSTFLNERLAKIDWNRFEEFTDNAYETVMMRYNKESAIRIEMYRKLGDFDGTRKIKELNDQYASNRDKILDKYRKKETDFLSDTDETISKVDRKELASLRSEVDSNATDMRASVNRLHGKFANGDYKYSFFNGFAGVVKSLVNTRLLGGGAVSQLPDMVNVVDEIARAKWGRMATETSDWMLENGSKQTKKQMVMTGVISRAMMDKRNITMWAGTDTSIEASSKTILGISPRGLSRTSSGLNSIGFTASGMTPMNNMTKTAVAENAIDTIVEVALRRAKGTKLNKNNIAYINELGLRESDLDTVAAQFKKHSHFDEGNGVTWNNLEKWEGHAATRVKASIIKKLDETIIAPNALQKPLLFDESYAAFLGQYKGFTASSIEKYLLKDLQQGNTGMARIGLRTIFGSAAYVVKAGAHRNWQDIDTDPKTLILEGLLRSGSLPVIGEASDIADQVFGAGLSSAFGIDRGNRGFYDGNTGLLKQIMGPAAIIPIELQRVVSNAKNGKASLKDFETIAKYSGVYDTIYMKYLINKMIKEGK